MACGIFHALALDSAGCVYSWGDGSSGQLGHADRVDRLSPHKCDALAGARVTRIAAAADHSACVTADGRLFTWGGGGGGKLGHGGTDDESSPRQVTGPLKDHFVVDVTCASEHTVCVTAEGRLFAWGRGGCQEGDDSEKNVPVEVEGVKASTQVRAGMRPPTPAPAKPVESVLTEANTLPVVESMQPTVPRLEEREDCQPRAHPAVSAADDTPEVRWAILGKSRGVDTVLLEHEKNWAQTFPEDASYPSAVRYLLERINVRRDLSPVTEPKQLRAMAYSLWRFRNQISTPDAEDLR